MQLRSPRALFVTAVAVVSLLSLGVQEASGQYFGRNKVQYSDFDWKVLQTEHFDIYHYASAQEAAVEAGRMAERWYARLSRILDHEIRGRQPIVLYADHPGFEQTNAVFGQIGEATGGVTEPLKRRIVLPLGASLKESDHVIGHELVHAFQFDITGQGPDAVGLDIPVALRMPLWFIEGMAEYLSIGSKDAFTTQWVRGAIKAEELPEWGDLRKPRYFPYRYGHALWAYIGGRFGDDAVGQLLKGAMRTGDMRQAFNKVLGIPADTLIRDWHEALERSQKPVLEATRPAEDFGRKLLSEETSGTQRNLGPALSPDGKWVVFASEKSLFAMELFLANTETGEIEQKLTETVRDPHFESLQWLSSSGAWSPDGERFAVAAVVRGRPVIAIFDPFEGKKLREIRVPEVGEIFNPTFSPDGRRLAFSGQVEGVTDLFVLDLDTKELRRLTDDMHADLQPAWSPDGRWIAEVTDRFTTELERLRIGAPRLALVDPETGERREVEAFTDGKHVNPQWGAGGEELFFLSDRNGVTNLYRMELADGRLYQITDLQTGISGISSLSPALSVARNARAAAFSVHGEGNFVFDVYTVGIDGETAAAEDTQEGPLAGEPVDEQEADLAALEPTQLPPAERALNRVDRLLADADLGLPDPITFETRDYSASLSLDFVGRPTLAVGTNEFGFFAGGGASLFFSDMLGNLNLGTLFQVNTSSGEVLNNTAAFATFTDRGGRWNWGVRGGQLPIIDRLCCGLTTAETDDGQTTLALSDIRFWQINREVTGILEYPFNRAMRLEFTGGARNIDFAAEERLLLLNAFGQIVDTEERDFVPLDTISSINTVRGSAALVYDNAVFGATAPMVGQRFRLQVTPDVGDLDYITALADFRRYFMPVMPFTLAFRGLHLGRYGGDSDDFRLGDFFIGTPSLIRGYDFGFGDFDNCDFSQVNATLETSCPGFDQFSGSRLGVFNAEARLPFIGGVGVVPAANVPPIDLLAFFDAGSAWDRGQEPEFLGGDRELITSAGVGARMNLFGLLVLEVDYVRAFDRVDDDWVWDFHITPGF